MKNINIGIVNQLISKKLKDAYFSKSLIKESKELTTNFLDVIKSSPILQLEFKVYDNIENKHIENDIIATRYIDNNIKLFEVYTLNEINKEHEKLKSFITEDFDIDDEKLKLYESIDSLIRESLSNPENVDVDNIHESFLNVLNHVKKEKKQVIENVETESINEDVIDIAIDKFNKKYESLDESDRSLFNKLIKSNNKEKNELFEAYKSENLTLLESRNKDQFRDDIAKAIQKIKEMKFNSKTVNNDIVGLHELKKGLL